MLRYKKNIAMNGMINANKGVAINRPLEYFNTLSENPGLVSLIAQIRSTEDADERRRLKGQLPFRCPHYFRFRDDHRSQESLVPEAFTFQTCVDIDKQEQVEPAMAKARQLNEQEGPWRGMLLRMERSASNKLHLDIRIPVGQTIEEAQRAYCQALGVEPDEDCFSPERMIYMVDKDSVIYCSDEWQAELPEEEIALRRKAYQERGLGFDGRPVGTDVVVAPKAPTTLPVKAYPEFYRGIPYTYLIDELEEMLGGKPEHGQRNDFILKMASHLRHVCNDDAGWVLHVLPNYGEAQSRVDETVRGALQRYKSAGMTPTMQLAIEKARQRMEEENGEGNVHELLRCPEMPRRLPRPVKDLLSASPRVYHPMIACAVWPAIATRLGGVKIQYAGGQLMEAALMCCTVDPMSSGKSAVNQPVHIILEDIIKRDDENREREQNWKDQQNQKGANEKGSGRPTDICVQVVDSDMTNAAFTQRLCDVYRAGNKALYTIMDEVEMLKKVAGGTMEQVTRIICRGFDCNMYGQERVGTLSVSGRAPLRWNFNASTTPVSAQRFFGKNIVDGTLSRILICTIIEEEGGGIPHFGDYGDEYRELIKPWLRNLDQEVPKPIYNEDGSVNGYEVKEPIVCRQAIKLAEQLVQAGNDRASLMDNPAYGKLSRRAAVISFRIAVLLWLMCGRKWSKDIEVFCRWVFDYDLWCKFRFFGKAIQEEFDKEQKAVSRCTPNMLDQLLDRFKREDLASLRRQHGKSENPKNQLAQWMNRGFIIKDEQTGEFIKTLKYLKRHAA